MSDLRILRFDVVDSTNNKAKEIAKSDLRDGIVVVATSQTEGRGSADRKWHSPPGGLYLSIILSPNKPGQSTDLSILGGVAMAQTVRDQLPKSVEISLKWPNDCLVNRKKVGGILAESLGRRHEEFCILGLGLNVNTSPEELSLFQTNPFGATSFLINSAGSFFDMGKVESVLLSKILSLYKVYRAEGFSAIRYLWEKNCRIMHKQLEVAERPPLPLGQKTPRLWTGEFMGIDDRGALVLKNNGSELKFVSAEILKVLN